MAVDLTLILAVLLQTMFLPDKLMLLSSSGYFMNTSDSASSNLGIASTSSSGGGTAGSG